MAAPSVGTTLFNVLLEIVMTLAVNEPDDFEALISGCKISNLRFADDILVEDAEDQKSLISLLNMTSERFELRISSTKAEVQLIATEEHQLQLYLGNLPIVQVDDITDLRLY